jgi:hypothetical protein
VQGVSFPAGARALPAGNPSISQEIMIKPSFYGSFWKKKYCFLIFVCTYIVYGMNLCSLNHIIIFELENVSIFLTGNLTETTLARMKWQEK